jgi:hypothetical protein
VCACAPYACTCVHVCTRLQPPSIPSAPHTGVGAPLCYQGTALCPLWVALAGQAWLPPSTLFPVGEVPPALPGSPCRLQCGFPRNQTQACSGFGHPQRGVHPQGPSQHGFGAPDANQPQPTKPGTWAPAPPGLHPLRTAWTWGTSQGEGGEEGQPRHRQASSGTPTPSPDPYTTETPPKMVLKPAAGHAQPLQP